MQQGRAERTTPIGRSNFLAPIPITNERGGTGDVQRFHICLMNIHKNRARTYDQRDEYKYNTTAVQHISKMLRA